MPTRRNDRVPRWRRRALTSTSGPPVLALSAFYGAGGLLCLLSLVVPAWPGRHEAIVLWVGVIATSVAAVLILLRPYVTNSARYVLVMFGSGLIAALMYAGNGGAATASYAGFYVFVAVYAFLFFQPIGATVQVLLALCTELTALLLVSDARGMAAQLMLSAGTIVATGAVVGVLASRVRIQAHTDELTGLLNRRAMDGVLERRLSSSRIGPSVALLGVDLDGFKSLNDQFGHAAGDRLLQRCASLWANELREGDVLARVGGDEFIVLLEECDSARAHDVAVRLVEAIPEPVSACVGIVVVPGGPDSSREGDLAAILEEVDRALYAGKARGRSSVVHASSRSVVPAQRGAAAVNAV